MSALVQGEYSVSSANLTLPLDLPSIELVDNVMVEVLADFGKGKQVVDNGPNAVEPKKEEK